MTTHHGARQHPGPRKPAAPTTAHTVVPAPAPERVKAAARHGSSRVGQRRGSGRTPSRPLAIALILALAATLGIWLGSGDRTPALGRTLVPRTFAEVEVAGTTTYGVVIRTTVTRRICGASCALWHADMTETFAHDGATSCIRGSIAKEPCGGSVRCSLGGMFARPRVSTCGFTTNQAGAPTATMDVAVHGVFVHQDYRLRIDNRADGSYHVGGGAR